MARAAGNDLCELFGYAPDDASQAAVDQWRSQECPFVGGTCIKHDNAQTKVYGSCSVVNVRGRRRGTAGVRPREEVIICPQRLYANNYEVLKSCLSDAIGCRLPVFTAYEYSVRKRQRTFPPDCAVLLGQKSGREINLSDPDIGKLALDWVIVRLQSGNPSLILPCEVQSIDTTGNYHAAWTAYSRRASLIPDSEHGMNWANVWKRLIPQLILKSAAASTCNLCTRGMYFVVPERVYQQFLKVVGTVPLVNSARLGTLTIMSYQLGAPVPEGQIRELILTRNNKMQTREFAAAFGAGGEMRALGNLLEAKVCEALNNL